MERQEKLTLLLEIIWWILTALAAFVVLLPIRRVMYDWPFQNWNVVFIVVLVTFSRYIFLLKHTFLARRQVLKVGIILALFPGTFWLVSGLNQFLSFIEERTWDPLTGHLPLAERESIQDYIWSEMLFFGTGSIITAVILAVRLFISIWTLHNRGVA